MWVRAWKVLTFHFSAQVYSAFTKESTENQPLQETFAGTTLFIIIYMRKYYKLY